MIRSEISNRESNGASENEQILTWQSLLFVKMWEGNLSREAPIMCLTGPDSCPEVCLCPLPWGSPLSPLSHLGDPISPISSLRDPVSLASPLGSPPPLYLHPGSLSSRWTLSQGSQSTHSEWRVEAPMFHRVKDSQSLSGCLWASH